MSVKTICTSIITYDTTLSSTLDAAILNSESIIKDIMGRDDYILYKNSAGSIGIESITLDPDGDNSDILELVIDNDDIHGMITMSSFEDPYDFLNSKVAEIKSGTDSNGNTYKYIRFDIASDFTTEYDSETHGGTITSMWKTDMERAQAWISIALFIPMARRIAEGTSIYVNENYGENSIVPTGIEEMNGYIKIYYNTGMQIMRGYYVRRHNELNSVATLVSNDLSDAKTNFNYARFRS